MRNFFFGVVAAYTIPVILVATLFLSLPKLARWHDAYSSIPAFVVRYPIVDTPVAGDFGVVSGFLQRQARIATWLGMTDKMRRDLVNNTYQVMETVRHRQQYSDLLPWLRQLSSLADNQYFAKLFLAEATAYTEPDKAASVIRPVRDLVPAYDRPYRPVIASALTAKDFRMLEEWCSLFASAELGGFRMFASEAITYEGQGIGHFVLETKDAENNSAMLPHQGYVLNDRRSYAFQKLGIPDQRTLRLHIPSLPGVKVIIHGIIIRGADGDKSFGLNDFDLFSSSGFFVDRKTAIITSYKGDVLTFVPRSGSFSGGDAIILDLEFRRLPLTNHQACR